jgi:hypothetical protein
LEPTVHPLGRNGRDRWSCAHDQQRTGTDESLNGLCTDDDHSLGADDDHGLGADDDHGLGADDEHGLGADEYDHGVRADDDVLPQINVSHVSSANGNSFSSDDVSSSRDVAICDVRCGYGLCRWILCDADGGGSCADIKRVVAAASAFTEFGRGCERGIAPTRVGVRPIDSRTDDGRDGRGI